MNSEQRERIERLQKGTERNCSDDRRRDTRGFIADALTAERKLYEANAELSKTVSRLRAEMVDYEDDAKALAELRFGLEESIFILEKTVVNQAVQLAAVTE